MQNIIVGQQQKYVKAAMKTVSGSSNWYSINKRVFLSAWYVYLSTIDRKLGLEGRYFARN